MDAFVAPAQLGQKSAQKESCKNRTLAIDGVRNTCSYYLAIVKNITAERERAEVKAAKVRLAELGLKHRDVAKITGLARGTVANILAAQYPCWPAKARVNAALGGNIFAPPETKQPSNQTMSAERNPRFDQEAAPPAKAPESADPAAANIDWEWNMDMGKIGFSVAFIQAPYSPALWENSGFEKRLDSELTEAGLGHLDSEKWGNPITFFFYLHSKSLAAGLQLVKFRLTNIGLLPHVKIGWADCQDKCWRVFHPAPQK